MDMGETCHGTCRQGPKQHGHLVARADFFADARQSVTAVTSTWSDGSRGPLGLCCPESFLKPEFMEHFNKEHDGEMFLFSSEGKGHFMHSGTMMTLMHGLLTSAFEKQRAKHTLPHTKAGLLLADGWTGYHAFRCGSDQARLAWILVWDEWYSFRFVKTQHIV